MKLGNFQEKLFEKQFILIFYTINLMNEIIPISNRKIGDNFVNSVSARELHKALGIKKDFSDWIKAQIKRGMFDQDIDFIVVWSYPQKGVAFLSEAELLEKFGNTHRARASGYQSDYILTLDTAKHISLMSGTEKGKEVRNYFIEVEKSYQISKKDEPDLELIRKRTELIEFSERQFSSFKKIFLEIGISEKNELAITSNRAVAKETGIDFIQLAELKGLEAKEKFFTVTELCETVLNSDQFSDEFKIQVSTKDGLKPRPQNLNLLLEFSEFQFRENGEWKLTEKGEDFGKLSQNKSKYSEKTVYHLVWSKRVLENLKI
jgi:phage anti-repressor protein